MTVETPPVISDSILDQIRKLHLHAESAKEIGSLAEAAAFAAKVTSLLQKYNLEMSLLDTPEKTEDDEISRGIFSPADFGVQSKKTRVEWQESLADSVARANFCRILVGRGMNTIGLVGRPHNREVATWLLGILVRDLTLSADKAYVRYFYQCKAEGDVTKARGYRGSFLSGAVSAIQDRLTADLVEAPDDVRALVLVNDRKLDNWMEEHSTGTLSRGAVNLINRQGLIDGIEHGKTLDLGSRAVRPGRAIPSLNAGRPAAVVESDAKLTALYAPTFEKLGIPSVPKNVGVAYNTRQKGFSIAKAVESAEARFGVKPDGYSFYCGVLYLSSSTVSLDSRWT